MGFGTSVIFRTCTSLGWWALVHRKHLGSAALSFVNRPWTEIRVSMSVLLRVCVNNRYLLIQNLHRPEHYTPIGGVIKFYPSARNKLDQLGFVEDPVDYGVTADRKFDLRGTLTTTAFPEFMMWFESRRDRESEDSAMRRELSEELKEAGIRAVSEAEIARVQFVPTAHCISEGPWYSPQSGRRQFRLHQVYEMHADAESQKLTDQLIRLSSAGAKLVLASSEEIRRGRCSNGLAIGGNANYLFGGKNLTAEPAQAAY